MRDDDRFCVYCDHHLVEHRAVCSACKVCGLDRAVCLLLGSHIYEPCRCIQFELCPEEEPEAA